MNHNSTRIIFTLSILTVFVSIIQGFPAQDVTASNQPKPIIESGVYRQAIDSYGNPVAYLEAAEAPDGRKFVHTGEGIQFEIPKYASGITDIKRPSDDLLPPLVPDDGFSLANDEFVILNQQGATNEGGGNSDVQTFFVSYKEKNNDEVNSRQILSFQQAQQQDPLKVQFNLEPLAQPNSLQGIAKDRTGKSLTESTITPEVTKSENDSKNNEHLLQLRDYFNANPDVIPISIIPSVEINISPLLAPTLGNLEGRTRFPRIEPSRNDDINTKEDNEKQNWEVYRGGFGGANGILGEQKQGGWYYKNKIENGPETRRQVQTATKDLNPLLPQKEDSVQNFDFTPFIQTSDESNSNDNSDDSPLSLNLNPFVPPTLEPIVVGIRSEPIYEDEVTTTIKPITTTTTTRRPVTTRNPNQLKNSQIISRFSISTVQGHGFPRKGFTEFNNTINNMFIKFRQTTQIPNNIDTNNYKSNNYNNNNNVYRNNNNIKKYNNQINNDNYNNIKTSTQAIHSSKSNYDQKLQYNKIETTTARIETKQIDLIDTNIDPSLPTLANERYSKLNDDVQQQTIDYQDKKLINNLNAFPEQLFSTEGKSTNFNLDLNPFLPPKEELNLEIENKTITSESLQQSEKDLTIPVYNLDLNPFLSPNVESTYETENLSDGFSQQQLQDSAINSNYNLDVNPLSPPNLDADVEKSIKNSDVQERSEENVSNPSESEENDISTVTNNDEQTTENSPPTENPSTNTEKNRYKQTNANIQPQLNLEDNTEPSIANDKSNQHLELEQPFLHSLEDNTKSDANSKSDTDLFVNINPFVPPAISFNWNKEGNLQNASPTTTTIKPTTTKRTTTMKPTTKRTTTKPYSTTTISTTTKEPLKNSLSTSTFDNSPIINIKIDNPIIQPLVKTVFTTTVRPTTEKPNSISNTYSPIQLNHRFSTSNIFDQTKTTHSFTQNTFENIKTMTTTPSPLYPRTNQKPEYPNLSSNTLSSTQTTASFPHNNSPLNKLFVSTTKAPQQKISTIGNRSNSQKSNNNDFVDQSTIISTAIPTKNTTTTTTTTTNTTITTTPTLSLLTNNFSSTSQFFTAAPPSRLFTPPITDRGQFSETDFVTDGSKDSNSNTFLGAPATSFAERLNFDKSDISNGIKNSNNLLEPKPTQSSYTTPLTSQQDVVATDFGANYPSQDLLPPNETPIIQTNELQPNNAGETKQIPFANNPFLSKPAVVGGVQPTVSVEQNQPTFANNPFLTTKPSGIAVPTQQGEQNNAGGFKENSASAFNNNNINNNYKNNHKFTGTFGGAPGILGNQKPGYAIRPTSSSSGNSLNSNSAVKPSVTTPSILNVNPTQNSITSKAPISLVVTAPPAAVVVPVPAVAVSVQNPSAGKYTGGFGGPPGVLSPYDNIDSRAST